MYNAFFIPEIYKNHKETVIENWKAYIWTLHIYVKAIEQRSKVNLKNVQIIIELTAKPEENSSSNFAILTEKKYVLTIHSR